MGGGDSIVRIALAIGRGVDDTRSIQDMGASTKRKENQSSSSSMKNGFQGQGHRYQGQGRVGASNQLGQMTCYYCHQP